MDKTLTRRSLLAGAALIGCSTAAYPYVTPVSLLQGPWENRLVVIILRGGMDGLDVVRPYGDPAYAAYRPDSFGKGKHLDLNGYFGLHPELAELQPLWDAGELGFAHAVSTPYRDKRSHFDGQDLLEAGTGMDVPIGTARDGWLNRMLQTLPGVTAETAFAVGREELMLLAGQAPVSRWAPEARLALSDQARRLLDTLYQDDPLFHQAAGQAMDLAESIDPMNAGGAGLNAMRALASFTAERLKAETRVAAFSISGWDSHRNQGGVLTRALKRLEAALLTLKADLGPVWSKTAVIAMTEFGRTARANGTQGTDHGTGGAMLYAGGALRGGSVLGRWPGLDEASLYERRDLMPTADIRAYAGWVMRDLFGLEANTVENHIFPGLDLGENPFRSV